MRDRHAAHFAGEAAARWDRWNGPDWRNCVDWVEIELGNLRAGFRWSMARGDVEMATDIAAHAGLMGFSIELFETVGWAERLVDVAAAAEVPRLPRLLTAAGYACFVGRADAARTNAHRAAELEQASGYDPCEPGYATFVEALGQVYCGDLDAYVELTGQVAALPGPSRAYAIAAHLDGLQSAGRVDEALALTEDAVTAARARGNPYWIAYTLWIVGLAWSKADKHRALSAWDEGIDFVRDHGVNFFDGFLARGAARLHTSDGDASTALELFDMAIRSANQAGNVAQLISLASLPALFERLERFDAAMTLFGALSKEPASFHHVPELAELEDRVTPKLGAAKAGELRAEGSALDLGDAAAYAIAQIDQARRELIPQVRAERPGGLSRREIEVLRLLADGCTTREVATRLFISAKTADRHIQNIYTKIGVSNRASATRWALEHSVMPDAVVT